MSMRKVVIGEGWAALAAFLAFQQPVAAGDLGSQVALQTWTLRNLSFEKVIEFAKSHGITDLQLIPNHIDYKKESKEELARKKAALEAAGLKAYTYGVAGTSLDKEENRKPINLDAVRRTKEYRSLLALGFKEDTSHQQELNNTLKFVRTANKQKEKGHTDVFYTIHPTGLVRRYNPVKSEDVPEGNGNIIKKFDKRFTKTTEYTKALNYLWQYLKRKEEKGDYR